MRVCRVLFSLVLLWFTAASLPSQTATSDSSNAVTTIRTKLQVVLVDVVVTNNKGEPVPGLRKEDFEIFEDNKPQTIATFAEHRGVPLTQIKLPPMPPGVYTNYPLTEKADAVNVLLLDALNTQTGDQAYVRAQMIKYLATISPGARVAVFTLASRLRMLSGITTDSAQLWAVLNDKKGAAGVHQSPPLPATAEDEADQHTIDFLTTEKGGHPPAQNGAQAAVDSVNALKQFMADAAAFQTESRVRVTLQALQQLARYLSDVPGRKNVIWFSSAFPVGIVPDPDLPDPSSVVSQFQQEIRKTTNLLATSQVAIYPVAAEGLNPDAVYEADGAEIGEKRPSMANIDQIKQMRRGERDRDFDHTVMEDIAKDTGGQAFYNTNGLGDALTRVIDNGTRYYSLSYTPTDRNMDGRFRRIRLNLQGAKYKLAYRRGYYAENPGTDRAVAQKQGNDPLLSLVGRNLPDLSQIVYKVRRCP